MKHYLVKILNLYTIQVKMLEHHDGTLTEEPVQEVKEENHQLMIKMILLDEMK
mgnify:CR=1 FL=1